MGTPWLWQSYGFDAHLISYNSRFMNQNNDGSKLSLLQTQMRTEMARFKANPPPIFFVPREEPPDKLLVRVKGTMTDLGKLLDEIDTPRLNPKTRFKKSCFLINRRDWDNVDFHPMTGVILKQNIDHKCVDIQPKRALRTLLILFHIRDLLENNSYSSKRDIYYRDPNNFESQRCVDDIIDDIACNLEVPRISLHILTSSKGVVYGDVSWRTYSGEIVEVSMSATGLTIPPNLSEILRIVSFAKYILIVEKDATFQKLIEQQFPSRNQCLMVTGKGFPDANTRRLVRLLWEHLKIPLLGVVDADAHGIEILCMYRYGSLSLAYDAPNLVCPQIRWLGIHPQELKEKKYGHLLNREFSDRDFLKLRDLKERPYIKQNPSWLRQIELLEEMKVKAEIQAFWDHDERYLTNEYLAPKIAIGDWI